MPTAARSRCSATAHGARGSWSSSADALQPQGRLQEGEEAYEEAIPELLAAGETLTAAMAMVQLSRAFWRHGKTERAREVSLEAVALLEAERGSGLVLALGRHAALNVFAGRSEEAIAWANRGIDLANEIRFENVTRALGMRGLARVDLGDPGGLDDLRSAVDLALQLNLPVEDTAIVMGNFAEMVILTEGMARGREAMEASREYARSRGHFHHVMYTRMNLLGCLFHEGRWDELILEADEVIEWDRERGGTQLELWALSSYALVHVHRGQSARQQTSSQRRCLEHGRSVTRRPFCHCSRPAPLRRAHEPTSWWPTAYWLSTRPCPGRARGSSRTTRAYGSPCSLWASTVLVEPRSC